MQYGWQVQASITVVRLDAKTNQPGTIVTVAKPCAGLVVGFGSLWIPSCGDHTVVRLTSARRFVGEGGAVAPSQNHNGRLRQGVCEVPQSNFRSLRPTAVSENDFELTNPSLERFRTSTKYQDRPAAADIAFCVAAYANGMTENRIERALEDDYLSRDPSTSKRAAYIRRTMEKARRWAER